MMFSSGPISQREVGLARHHRIGYHCVAQGPGGLDAGWYPIPVGVQMQQPAAQFRVHQEDHHIRAEFGLG